tara:strand:- start:640 stop:762 length:123 start_codon:yes stop_codon:yes gene_type:complete
MAEMEFLYEGSKCGRYVYGVIYHKGVEIDRYIDTNMMENL